MNALSRRLRPAILPAALLVTLLVPASGADADESYTKAPDFRAVDLAGERFSLGDLLGKGPILVDFWATWCKPCIKELPYVQRIHDDLAESGVQVLAVTIDSPKSQAQVRKFIQSRKFTFRVVMDGEQDVFRKLQGKGTVPYVVVLDAQGNIRYHHTGYRPGDEKELRKIVEELMAEGDTQAIDAAAREAEAAG
jgi:cytochrome c biogenesis protein CcmG, thiol:disulfide interchange protein DsbE